MKRSFTVKLIYILILLFAMPALTIGQEVRFIPQIGFEGYAKLEFSPDGKLLASYQNGKNCIVIWDISLSKEIGRLKGKYPKFSPDGRRLAYLENMQLCIYDLTSGTVTATGVKNTAGDPINPFNHDFLVFAPGSGLIAMSSTAVSPQVLVYSINSRTVVLNCPGYDPQFTSDSNAIIYAVKNKLIKRDLNTQAITSIELKGNVVSISSAPWRSELFVIAEKDNDSCRMVSIDPGSMKLISEAVTRFGECHPYTSVFVTDWLNDTLVMLQRRNYYPFIWNLKQHKVFRENIEMDKALFDKNTGTLYTWFDGSNNFDAGGYCTEDTVGRIIATDLITGKQQFSKGLYCKSYFEELALHPVLPVLASGANSRVILNDLSVNPRNELSGFSFDLRNFFFDPASNNLITLTRYYLSVLSLDKLQVKDIMSAADIVFSSDGKQRYLLDENIYLLDSNYRICDTIDAGLNSWRDSRLSISSDGKMLALYNGSEIIIYDAAKQEQGFRTDIACIWDKGLATPLLDMGLSPTGRYLFYINTPGTERSCNESGLLLYDLNEADGESIFPEHKILGENEYDFEFEQAAMFTDDEKYLINIQADQRTIRWFDLGQRKVVRKVSNSDDIFGLAQVPRTNSFLTLEHGSFTIRNLSNGEKISTFHICNSDINMARFNKNSTILALGTSDNTIVLFDWVKKKKIATVMTAYGRALIFTDDNYYFSSKELLKAIAFVSGGKAYNFEQFDIRYNRPDIILERIGLADTALIKAYRKAVFKRMKKMNIDPSMFTPEFHVPEIEIRDQNDIPVNTIKQELMINVLATDTKYKLDRVNVWVNDVPLFGLAGYDLKYQDTDSADTRISIPLSAGENKIQISCMNEKGTESRKATFNIVCDKQPEHKPDLYLVTIGVSDYPLDMDLKYPVKDGRDVIKLFTGHYDQGKSDFATIYIDSLFNENATRDNILSLKKKLLRTKVNDVVIVSVSGHGLLDQNLDFYYATSDIDFNNPAEKGLKYADLETLLDSIPSRQKMLLVDACHSGEVDKDMDPEALSGSPVNNNSDGVLSVYGSKGVKLDQASSGLGLNKTFELMQMIFTDLSKGTGTIVISAAAGTGIAIEGDAWKNGVFTYALINGLKNLKADVNEDGKIMTWELKAYIAEEVVKLTNGLQKPTIRTESIDSEWKVW